MWIYFEYKSVLDSKRFVVRPFVGGVNAISGETSAVDMGSLLRRKNAPKQDYLVFPEQRWLDGIATRPGLVKQFVATAMAPPRDSPPKGKKAPREKRSTKHRRGKSGQDDSYESEQGPAGASIEWQVTGKDEIGGLQLQIIPTFDVERMWASSVNRFSKLRNTPKYDILKTPEGEGLRSGDTMYIKDLKHIAGSRDMRLGDLLAEAPTTLVAEDVIELEVARDDIPRWIFDVSLDGKPDIAVSLEVSLSISVIVSCLVRLIRPLTIAL